MVVTAKCCYTIQSETPNLVAFFSKNITHQKEDLWILHGSMLKGDLFQLRKEHLNALLIKVTFYKKVEDDRLDVWNDLNTTQSHRKLLASPSKSSILIGAEKLITCNGWRLTDQSVRPRGSTEQLL